MKKYYFTRKCNRCGQYLPKDAFNKCTSNKDGVQPRCKECCKQYNKDRMDRVRQVKAVEARKLSHKKTIEQRNLAMKEKAESLMSLPKTIGRNELLNTIAKLWNSDEKFRKDVSSFCIDMFVNSFRLKEKKET